MNAIRAATIGILLATTVVGGQAEAKKKFVNGDFEAGNSGFRSDYTVTDQACNDIHGVYIVATSPSAVNCYGDWGDPGDHTTGAGMMMIMDGATGEGVSLWSETVKVVPQTDYRLIFWGTTLVKTDWGNAPAIQVSINGVTTGVPLQLPDAYDGVWHKAVIDWNSGSATKTTISLIDLDTVDRGNDFAIDDLNWKKKR